MERYETPNNLVDLFEDAVKRFKNNPLFGVKNKEKTGLDWMTYGEAGARVDNLRAGLAQMGVGKNDVVGFIGNNRPEWAISAFATYGAGARFVPMYEAELESTWEYIIRDSDVKVLIVSKPAIFDKVSAFADRTPGLERIFIIETQGEGSLGELEALGAKNPVESVKPDKYDVAALVYTSGTTGEPKGVLLSHQNFSSNAAGGYHLFTEVLNEEARSLSILPWAHSYGQTAELYNWMQFGGSIGFMESVETLADDLALVSPTFMIAVPRVFNKIYDGLQAKMKETGGLPKALFDMGVKAAKEKRELAAEGKSNFLVNLKFKLADKIVFQKIRDKFGGRLQGALTGSALMNPEISHFFADIGVPVFDCYGLSETSPAVSMNCFSAYKVGSVGRPIENVKVVIDQSGVDAIGDDGEIIVYGPNVMQGYHNKPEATAAAMTAHGGFRTGDRGRIDEDGFLFITGRIKEEYKLQNGKYVYPGAIEEDIRLLPNVANAMLSGEGKKYNVCLVVPDFEVLGDYARQKGLSADPFDLVENKEVTDMIAAEITAFLKGKYGGYEIPKKFIFLADDFTLDNGMLTQTMKLKRKAVFDKYNDAIEDLYKE
ncbi:Long-chain-fatty-acid CoA ligase (AMP-forming) [Desulfatibacillum aliphaticivorans]|uniref:Long-chain-fatty-acid CoA ligase (AMP-forming) n=1 Tax=Desulfatibacillum aliphaticivorans TaxID=218208 RepID=B8FGJ4_DESAL|nr:long-chain fatty acid--CoA ligase [Desulfatibacillum aliphaticivorans]ACL04903.1 Long-chain-fatty-acid CoA ligase (AMP-forming) [Desulfatibacillum aliphaticivorans]